jgi:peptide methionine sulfoxide reductase MsrA
MGTAKYTLDSELPDMLYAVLVKSPYLDATIKSVDSNEATKSVGVVKIVREGNLLAVVAKNFYAAEDYHQKFYDNNPSNGYCNYVIKPKLDKFEKVFKDKLRNN